MKTTDLKNTEYGAFYKNYIVILGDAELIESLDSSYENFLKLIKTLPMEKYDFAYAEGKWTIKELIQHLIDTERIFCYRALRFSRKDTTELAGYDENFYVQNSKVGQRNIKGVLQEFNDVRMATISLFKSFDDEMLLCSGMANGNNLSVRALGFLISGHQVHHLNIIKERYL